MRHYACGTQPIKSNHQWHQLRLWRRRRKRPKLRVLRAVKPRGPHLRGGPRFPFFENRLSDISGSLQEWLYESEKNQPSADEIITGRSLVANSVWRRR